MPKKNAIVSMVLLSFGSLIGAFFAFLTQVILARNLEIASFGVFSATLATVVLASPLAGFGVSQLWLKLYGEEGWNAKRWLIPSFHFVLISTLSVIATLGAWALFGNHDKVTQTLILVLSFHILGQVSIGLVSSKLQLEERYINFSAWQLSPHITRLFLISLLAYLFTDSMTPEAVAFIYAFTGVLFSFLSILQLRKMLKDGFLLKGHGLAQPILHNSLSITSVVKNTWPFGLATFFYLVYYQSDLILIKYMINDAASGIYNVAFTIIMATLLFPGVIYQKYLLPKLHRWANHDKEKFYMVYRKGNFIMLIFGITAMLLIWSLSSWAVVFLFGAKYENAIAVLNILAISIPFVFVAHSTGATLVTQSYMKKKVKYMGLVALLNIVLNLFLIPKFGITGAAISTVVSNIILLLLYYYASENIVFSKKTEILKGQK